MHKHASIHFHKMSLKRRHTQERPASTVLYLIQCRNTDLIPFPAGGVRAKQPTAGTNPDTEKMLENSI